VLGHRLDPNIPDGSEVDLTLFIRNPLLQITQNRTGFAPLTNWDMSETQITVNDGIVAYDPTWTNNGVPMAMDVYSESTKDYGVLYVEVRYWLPDLSFDVNAINDPGNLDQAISGALDPDNPLKWGVFQALTNSNGVDVTFTSVANPPDPESWANVLNLLLGRDDVYGLVPLTYDHTVLQLYQAHVNDQSTPEQGLWRVLWVNLQAVPEIPVIAAGSNVPGYIEPITSDGQVALGTITQDPGTVGTAFTILRCTSENAEFIQNGVRPGDVVRCLYTSDGFGNMAYSEFVVDEVESEDTIRLLVGPDAPITVPAKFEIWRNLTPTEEAQAIGINSGSWGDRRVRATWPDQIESGGTVMAGYFMNCSLAALSGGVLPQQGLTHLAIDGFTSVKRTTSKFNRSQLDEMALGGTWIVTQDLTGIDTSLGEIYTRHALTTGNYEDLNQREEMVTRNVDSISFQFRELYAPYIGVTNVTLPMQLLLEQLTGTLIDQLRSQGTAQLGGQLVNGTIVSFRPHLLLKDRYVAILDLQLPYPFNNIEVHLTIGQSLATTQQQLAAAATPGAVTTTG
jgi:hypothetical protein